MRQRLAKQGGAGIRKYWVSAAVVQPTIFHSADYSISIIPSSRSERQQPTWSIDANEHVVRHSTRRGFAAGAVLAPAGEFEIAAPFLSDQVYTHDKPAPCPRYRSALQVGS